MTWENSLTGMSPFAATPEPPYYVVIFTSRWTPEAARDPVDYYATAERMHQLASGMPGFLGIESARGADGMGITVSYWATEQDIAKWKQHLDHRAAQQRGKREWYEHYELRVAKVERSYSGPAGR